MTALANAERPAEAGRVYNFVYLDLEGRFHASGEYLFADDEAAQAHAQRILAGVTLVVVYRDGCKRSLLANLC
jgi:hypothetical protein